MVEALDIHVKGIVQGVGFRPFVYRLAKRYLINGWVLNSSDGVHIRAEGDAKLLDEFVMEISENAPSAAQVREIEMHEVPLEPYEGFEIRFSDDAAVDEATDVSPDLAICADCARELMDADNRRYHYPFINCTNCGPRFTIIDALPYDRENTSMRAFEMCDPCQAEYTDPADRRFHAQPNACFQCGPHVFWYEVRDACASGGNADADMSIPAASGVGDCKSDAGDGGALSAAGLDGSPGRHVALTLESSDAIFDKAVDLLASGGILAIKGLGGYHLACDANNPAAIANLRERKHRFGKPFAVMMGTADDVREVCEVGVEENATLTGAIRPIVLLRKQIRAHFAKGLADDLGELGVMLPYTPVQMLLLDRFARAWRESQDGCQNGFARDAQFAGGEGLAPDERLKRNPPMLVMTSGNMHDEPIVIDDVVAMERLGGIADAFIGNDREIRARFDDSVVRIIKAGMSGETVQMIRRARGYAPMPISAAVDADGVAGAAESVGSASASAESGEAAESTASEEAAELTDAISVSDKGSDGADSILAVGPEQKNTFAYLRRSDADVFVSPHIGDMEDADTMDAWLETKARYAHLFKLNPDELACDMHPEYITTKWAHEQASLAQPPLPVIEVQHHHAHIASVVGEHGLPADAAVCGIAFDGTGYGVDGNIWGGEVLIANRRDFERFANFAYVPMPGGAAAVKNPLQMAYGVLWEFDLLDRPGAKHVFDALGDRAKTLDSMIEQGVNTPHTSSVGRLFDAASAMLGVSSQPAYEGEAAVLLEACMYGDGEEVIAGYSDRNVGTGGEAANDAGIAAANDSADDDAGNDADNDAATSAKEYKIDVVKNVATDTSTAQDTSVLLFDPAPLFEALLEDVAAEVPIPVISKRFHQAFVDAIVQAAQLAYALYGIKTVALSGGVFMNRYIIEHSLVALEEAGFTVAINRDLPPNDGCVSYGQACVAFAR